MPESKRDTPSKRKRSEEEEVETPSKKSRREAAAGEASAVLVAETVPTPLTVDDDRYKLFMELLNKCVNEKFQAQELEISVIRKFFDKQKEKKPFSNEEIDACIERMSDENKVMRSDDTVYII